MAWHYGTFSCGHEGRVNIIGPTKDRQWKADKKFSGMCEECYKKYLEQKRAEENKDALEATLDMDLPELTGTEKQVAWANTIRINLYNELNEYKEEMKCKRICLWFKENMQIKSVDEFEEMLSYFDDALDFYMLNTVKASTWIDNRNSGSLWIEKTCCEMIKNFIEHNEKWEDEETLSQVISDIIVAPKEVKHVGTAVITVKVDSVSVSYQKNTTFMDIVKTLGYKWDNGEWVKQITKRMTSAGDRAAELGNKLLNAGFTISIQDEDTRNNAINGTYEKEYDRWITMTKRKIGIWWLERNDSLYRNARKITGSKWESPYVMVAIENFAEVIDFADAYGFGIDDSVHEAIGKHKAYLEKINKVEPVEVVEEEAIDKLDEILETPVDILDDLKDE